MHGHRRIGWAVALAGLLFAAALAMIAYNVGVSDGMVAAGPAADAARRVQWGWHGGAFVWLFFFAILWLFAFRGGCWRRRYWYGPGWGPYDDGARPMPPFEVRMDEWHRRAHDRMKEERPADDSGRRG